METRTYSRLIPLRAGNGEVAAWRCSRCGLALPVPDPRDAEIAALKRYLEEARVAKRASAVTATALSAAQVQVQVLREALEFYAEPTLYEPKVLRVEAGVTHEDPLPILDDLGTTAGQALQDVFGDQRPDVGCVVHESKGPLTLDDLRDRFTEEELLVVDSTFGGGAKRDEIILRMFHEAALARKKAAP